MLKLPVSRLGELYSLIGKERELYLPLEANGLISFGRWAPGAAARLDWLNSARPVKDFYFPQTENLASFQIRGKEIRIEEDRDPGAPFAVFGVRACDGASLDLLDRVFLSDPADTFYQARRQNGVIIANACTAPEETCFCGAFGVDAAAPGGDVSVWLVNDMLYWESKTDKGDALTLQAGHLFEETGSRDAAIVAKQQADTRAVFDKLPLKDLRLEGFAEKAEKEIFHAAQWGGLYQACLGCGSCTFVCPTCHCYDIRDFDTGRGIRRFRCWDSCMYSDFTMMASGNPRQSQLERFRQRFMHKLVYFPMNNESLYACVGCGRCIVKCPISMNIVKVIKTLGVDGNA